MKILVTGNCQARPLGSLLSKSTSHEVLEPIILHLSNAAEQDAHMERIAQADFILAQATAPVFQPAHLRSDVLQEQFAGRVVVWPNVFFVGQHPYLRYLTHAQAGRVLGPMEATHDIRVVNAWFRSRQGLSFNESMTEPGYEQRVYDTSLRDLRGRESKCDVAISDLIEAHFEDRQLFFTFNHPSLFLLTRLAERVLDRVGKAQTIDVGDMKEPLGQFRPPWRFSDGTALRGRAIDLSTAGEVKLGPPRRYSQREFEETSFACYDHLAAQMDPSALRMTPRY